MFCKPFCISGHFFLIEEDIAMNSGLKWMVLVIVALVSTSAWAIWNPNTDPNLIFYVNFETYSNSAHTVDSTKPGPLYSTTALVGNVADYNTGDPNICGEASRAGLGSDANFALMHDSATGKGVPEGNDVKLEVADPIVTLFDLGDVADKHTWTFWFNAPSISDGTMLRHAEINYYSDPSTYGKYLWEIRISGGVLQFYHKNNCLTMQTASTLSDLGLTANTWHHVAVVIDRTNCIETGNPTTQLSSKIYIDGLEVPIIVVSLNSNNMNVDLEAEPAPLWIGTGEREYDGLLDDIRFFSGDLTPLEVSILNQPDATIPRALLPIPRSSNVVVSTDLTWAPATGAVTAQKLYFGTNTDANLLPLKSSGNGSMNSATNASIGPLARSIKYYWYIQSTIGGVDSNGPVWSFTTETGKALNPSPRDGAVDIDVCDVNLAWSTPSPATYAVYASADQSLVAASDVSVRIANGISDPCFMGYDPNLRGAIIYWRVNSTYTPGGTIAGDIWSFRTNSYDLVFNTSCVDVNYADHTIPAYTCLLHSNGWSDPCATGSLASDGVAVFPFPSGFNYDKRYDIVVVPAYRATDIFSPTDPCWFPTPLAIHATGDFYFDGRVQIAGDDELLTSTTNNNLFARSGGFPGPKYNQDASAFGDRTTTHTDYWTDFNMPVGYHGRFGTIGTAKIIYVPTALAKSVWGPGQPVNPPYKGGGGGGYGGIGGDSGRGYFFGVDTTGHTYGDKEVPVPFGGSAGGWGGTGPGGGSGGGGVEIVATGNVTLDVNSQINAKGGGQLCSSVAYPAGGGSGGSVRIIAGGSVTNKGIIDVNGGIGGNGAQANNTGGGGGGGRVAIFYGTTYSNTGTIVANGGARGISSLTVGLAKDGQNGTIFDSNGSPKKASAPTPANGNKMVYCHPDPCTMQLKWYSGYGGTTDEVFCDTNPNPTTSRGSVAATRGQHSVGMTVASGNTYYMKVVTDGAVSSDIWSFKTVDWRCRQYDGADVAPTDSLHVGGPEWDFNHDCGLDIEDFEDFADNWLNPAYDTYVLEFIDFARLASEWHTCFNRTDGGCAGF
jgi:hypothetical protein